MSNVIKASKKSQHGQDCNRKSIIPLRTLGCFNLVAWFGRRRQGVLRARRRGRVAIFTITPALAEAWGWRRHLPFPKERRERQE